MIMFTLLFPEMPAAKTRSKGIFERYSYQNYRQGLGR